MPQVQLDDQVFKVAQRRAADGGYSSVDEYIAHVVVQDTSDVADNVDHLFTPERLAHIDKAEADIQAGKFYTTEQAAEELANAGQNAFGQNTAQDWQTKLAEE